MSTRTDQLLDIYQALFDRLGPSHWWPGESALEIAIGAILTQNTNWNNAKQAIENIDAAGLLSATALVRLGSDELAELIRPAGYFRVKARRLKNLLAFLDQEVDLDLQALGAWPLEAIREGLLGVNGIGPETADSIALYALNKPTFVVDSYTARVFHRHGLVPEEVSYQELRALFMDALPQDSALFNEYHALIVRTGKRWCKKRGPACQDCPLRPFLPL